MKRIFLLILSLMLILAACSPTITPEEAMDKSDSKMEDQVKTDMMEEPDEAAVEPTSGEMMSEDTTDMDSAEAMDQHESDMSTEMMEEKPDVMDEAMSDTPAWFSAGLTDVRTGTTFTIHDYQGKVVLVETLAMWCSNCRQQQRQVKAFHEMLGINEDLISIGLDIDPNENAEDLRTYTEQNGFDWVYAISPAEVSREISNLYGTQFLNPPSTPIVIIDRSGQAHPMPFGIKSADDLLEFIQPFLDEGM